MLFTDRHLGRGILTLMQEEPALLIQGPRAVGKTTLLERIAHRYDRPVIDFSDDVVREIAAEDVRGYLDRRPRPVLIDEYQHLPAVLGGVK